MDLPSPTVPLGQACPQPPAQLCRVLPMDSFPAAPLLVNQLITCWLTAQTLYPGLSHQQSPEATRKITANGTWPRRDLPRKLRGRVSIDTALCQQPLALIKAGNVSSISFLNMIYSCLTGSNIFPPPSKLHGAHCGRTTALALSPSWGENSAVKVIIPEVSPPQAGGRDLATASEEGHFT